MGRYDIALNRPPKEPSPISTSKKWLAKLKDNKLSKSAPVEETNIAERGNPSTVFVMQWPLGHRTIIPFRNLHIDLTNEGQLTIHLGPTEARRILEDIAEARRRMPGINIGDN